MSNYELQIKQVVDYPLCRIYRQFIQSLIKDRNIRLNGGSGLFYSTMSGNKIIKYSICDWKKHNTVLDYTCPCQKESGFFLYPKTA